MQFRLAQVFLLTATFHVVVECHYKTHRPAYSSKDNFPFRKPESQSIPMDSPEEVDSKDEEGKKTDKTICPSCGEAKLSEEEIRRLRIEKIKQTILHKLRLKARPNVTISREDLPTPLSHGQLSSRDNSRQSRVRYDYYGRTERVIIFPDQKSISCYHSRHHPAECLHFPQSTNYPEGTIYSAELWVYKLEDDNDYRNQSFIINELVSKHKNGHLKRSHVVEMTTPLSSGWIQFDVKNALRHWLVKPGFPHWLEVVCKSCATNSTLSPISQSNGQRPFLVLSMDHNEERMRSKRSTTCNSDTTHCCRENLFISFHEIGWNDWILQPHGYTANYCKGSCIEDVTIPLSKSHHTTVMQRYVQNKKLTADQKVILSPCCTPTHMSDVSLLYMAESGTIMYKTLPDMVVEACGCS